MLHFANAHAIVTYPLIICSLKLTLHTLSTFPSSILHPLCLPLPLFLTHTARLALLAMSNLLALACFEYQIKILLAVKSSSLRSPFQAFIATLPITNLLFILLNTPPFPSPSRFPSQALLTTTGGMSGSGHHLTARELRPTPTIHRSISQIRP